MEKLSLRDARAIFEFEVEGTGRRLLIDGAAEYDPGARGVARVLVGGDAEERGVLALGLVKDSDLRLRLPSSELDSEDTYAVELRFFTGEDGQGPVVLICGEATLPPESVLVLLERIERTITEADLGSGGWLNLGREARGVALTPLDRRIAAVEQSVRDALDDERFTSEDYEALQRYPARLAMVERLAKSQYDHEPRYRSFEPEGRFGRISAVTFVDWFHKWASDVEGEARDSTARMSGLISSQQIVLTQRQAGQAARFQRLVTIVGAAVLVPGLVAAIFGANVGFAGRESTHAFWAMLLLMAGSGLCSYALITVAEVGIPAGLRRSRPIRWAAGISPEARLGIAGAAGAALVLGGAAVLVASG